ncbi:hypothetical protein THIOKS11900003 [Thiocapsa sp. KS1]|nr:hypothetical protein THIOKS11900003 [Thiocapsa sp. KS1]
MVDTGAGSAYGLLRALVGEGLEGLDDTVLDILGPRRLRPVPADDDTDGDCNENGEHLVSSISVEGRS